MLKLKLMVLQEKLLLNGINSHFIALAQMYNITDKDTYTGIVIILTCPLTKLTN